MNLPIYLFTKIAHTGNNFRFVYEIFRLFIKTNGWKNIIKRYLIYKYYRTGFKYNLSIVMCVKDEALYIQEFIEYYKIIGVQHFYIYNNNGTDNTPDILAPYIKQGLVTYQDYPGIKVQNDIYNHAVDNYKFDTKWMMIVDIDEFVLLLKHKSISDFLNNYSDCSEISMHWLLYGDSHHKKIEPGLVTERFIYHDDMINGHVKSIVNPRAVLNASIHYSYVFGKSVDENRKSVYSPIDDENSTGDIIRVNHYSIKSWEEFSNKKIRGRADRDFDDLDKEFYDFYNRNQVSDDLMKPFVKKIKKVLKQD